MRQVQESGHFCQICGSKTRLINQPAFGRYHVCPTCEFIAKDAGFFISPEHERHIYDQHQNSIDDPRYVAYFKRFISAAVLPFLSTGRQGLDFGSGPEPVLAQILASDYGFIMDIYDLFYAPEKVYRGRQYNLITCTEVAEHLADPVQYFNMFRQLLAPGGILALMTLFHPQNDQQFSEWFYIRDRSHISFYTPRTMQCLAEMAGLKIIFTDSVRYVTFTAEREELQ